ncbi:HD domain-containing phosphohydrolase [Arcobacter lacus]|uniref:Response regulator receiver protein n=1 Tax=Arcobacter lacus TaxID=1912876 RepID=A0ABX5JGQ0_9BACT|nr:HD domain-containing phosphohydrolase [Arcobacter lacus]PUE66305.1 response regulator receiver protein [Arcobacter lacus]
MKNILYFCFTFFVLLLLSYKLYYVPEIKNLTNQIYLNKSVEIKEFFKEEVEKKKKRTFALTYLISQDKRIITALESKNNSSITSYKEIIEEMGSHNEFKNLWLQVIDKNGHSFYRSWTNDVGEDVTPIRIDVESMIKNPRTMEEISAGRIDISFKTMIPLYDNKKEFVGMVELISKFNSIAEILKEKNIEPIMIVNKDYSKNIIQPFSNLFIDEYYVANVNASKNLMEMIKKEGIQKFLDLKGYMIFNKYLITTYEIKDINSDDMGFFIFLFSEKNINKSVISEFKTAYLSKVIIFMIISGLLFLYLLNKAYTKALKIRLKEQTSQMMSQEEELKSLYEIYDKNVIFSVTDLKGTITHASSAFCKISGYTKKELIGKPHNIIRHPETPKETFKKMWEQIQKGNKFTAELKNLRKDGSFYWVVAEIEPKYDKKGNHIGYFAVREDITANKEIEEIQKEIIFTMGSIAESRSKETSEHIERVAKYTELIALELGLEPKEAKMLKLASPMHDIGKIAIPDYILNKPAKLTPEEFEIVKTHTIKGYEMLNLSERPLLKTAAIIALTHHEKYDGTGYPKGLKGEEIPLYGRITAIADVFDALAHERCYKKAWRVDKIVEYIKEERGKHFDPKLVDLFFENFDKILEIKKNYQ